MDVDFKSWQSCQVLREGDLLVMTVKKMLSTYLSLSISTAVTPEKEDMRIQQENPCHSTWFPQAGKLEDKVNHRSHTQPTCWYKENAKTERQVGERMDVRKKRALSDDRWP